MARMMTRFVPAPRTMNPPIITLSPVCTKARVEMLPSLAGGVGVDVGVGVGVAVAVGVTVGVDVAATVAVGVTVGVLVGLAVAVAIGLGLAVAVGVGDSGGPACAQYRPPVLSPPPQIIISLPVQTAVCSDRAGGA